jgi:starch synthase
MISSEVSPLAKTGGLGDILGSLPEFLNNNGQDARVLLPAYKELNRSTLKHIRYFPSRIHLGPSLINFSLEETVIEGANTVCYLLHCNDLYNRDGMYGPRGGAFEDNDIRFAFQCKVALEVAHLTGWKPEIFHCHDWGASLVPVYQKVLGDEDPQKHVPSILTIHSLEHQGHFHRGTLDRIGLPFHLFNPDRLAHQGKISFMEAGLWWANAITTVSPTYAKEIQTPEYGFGLDGMIRSRSADVHGILNGIREYEWDPQTDKRIAANFSSHEMGHKVVCKAALQERMGLPVIGNVPLVGCVSRLFQQKGMDRLGDILPRLANETNFQLVVLGSGEASQENQYHNLQKRFPDKISLSTEFDPDLAHQIMAGSDLFIMPSRYEPCGLSQIYAMRYGSLPIVRITGGLVDTVKSGDFDTEATGFHFSTLNDEAMMSTMHWAFHLYRDKPQTFKKMQVRAMEQDFSWDRSAIKYVELYNMLTTATH